MVPDGARATADLSRSFAWETSDMTGPPCVTPKGRDPQRAATSPTFLRPHLLDAVLVSSGVLDGAAVERALQPDTLIWRAASLESWIRYWQTRVPDVAATGRNASKAKPRDVCALTDLRQRQRLVPRPESDLSTTRQRWRGGAQALAGGSPRSGHFNSRRCLLRLAGLSRPTPCGDPGRTRPRHDRRRSPTGLLQPCGRTVPPPATPSSAEACRDRRR